MLESSLKRSSRPNEEVIRDSVLIQSYSSLEGFTISSAGKLTTRKIAKIIAGFASDKKAEDIVILDIRKVANFCDYFVLCSGNSDRQVVAIGDGIKEGLHDMGIKVTHGEKDQNASWILLDLGDVIVHIFQKEARDFYGLEHLWQDAKKIDWQK